MIFCPKDPDHGQERVCRGGGVSYWDIYQGRALRESDRETAARDTCRTREERDTEKIEP